ncbi:unnamed protein product, partial [Closterium sp. NIES-53]
PLLHPVPLSRSPGSSSPSLPDSHSPFCSSGTASPHSSNPVRCVTRYLPPLGSPSGLVPFSAVLLTVTAAAISTSSTSCCSPLGCSCPSGGGAGVGAESVSTGGSSLRGAGVSQAVPGSATTGSAGAPSTGPGEFGTGRRSAGGAGSLPLIVIL